MSGHSHFRTIQHKKSLEDQRRGKTFSKLARLISVAAREKGGNPETNSALRLVIERAKNSNMPKDNIERAIKKGTGELKGEVLESIFIEAYGPGGVALIIEGITDNKNRTIMEIKQILVQNNGKIVNEGGVQWLFERKINPESGSLEWISRQNVEISEKDKKSCEKLFESLDENEAVQKIYHNINYAKRSSNQKKSN